MASVYGVCVFEYVLFAYTYQSSYFGYSHTYIRTRTWMKLLEAWYFHLHSLSHYWLFHSCYFLIVECLYYRYRTYCESKVAKIYRVKLFSLHASTESPEMRANLQSAWIDTFPVRNARQALLFRYYVRLSLQWCFLRQILQFVPTKRLVATSFYRCRVITMLPSSTNT